MFRIDRSQTSGRKVVLQVILLSLLAAVFGTGFLLSPLGQKLEEEIGLPILFRLRGPVEPPDKAVIVSLDHESAEKFGFPENFSKWPRSVHADLVKKLQEYGAAVIAFDVHFPDSTAVSEDIEFAGAISRANNVILYEKLRRKSVDVGEQAQRSDSIEVDILVPPTARLAEAALAIAPFPLPKIPVRVSQAWLFKGSAGDAPTLPVVALQAMALPQYDKLYMLLEQSGTELAGRLPPSAEEIKGHGGLVHTMQVLRELHQQQDPDTLLTQANRGTGTKISGAELDQLEPLVRLYGGRGSVYINFYGPPESFTTISYHEILAAEGNPDALLVQKFRDKVVFVGAARAPWSDQQDGFYTVYSQPDGLDLNGVEIAATVFSNLLEDSAIKTLSLPSTIAIIAGCAVAFAIASIVFSPIAAIASLLLFSTLYLLGARSLFAYWDIWVPFITPAIVLPAAVFMVCLVYRFLRARRERGHIRKALSMYLPSQVVTELSRDLSYIKKGDRMVYSACLMSDAQNYTTLSEKLTPQELSEHMNEYFQYLFKPVNESDGQVANVIGDCMLALWPSTEPQVIHKENACRAALQIMDAINQFNRKYPDRSLPTRIGLHFGQMLMGNVGAEGHFEYAPVGDIVNATQRVEGLNKKLGTMLLASDELVEGTTGVMSRALGRFLLAGKSNPLTIHELLVPGEETSRNHQLYFEVFPEALDLFMRQEWEKARDLFQRCLDLDLEDGPSLFYWQMSDFYRTNSPDDWQGVITVTK